MKHKHKFYVSKNGVSHTFYTLNEIGRFLCVGKPRVEKAFADGAEIKGFKIIEDKTFFATNDEPEEEKRKYLLTIRFEKISQIARLLGKTELYCTQVFAGIKTDEMFDIDEVAL